MSIFSYKPPKRPMPPWLKWAVVGFMALALYNGYRSELSDNPDAPKIENYPTFNQFISKEHWQPVINPHPNETTPQEELEIYGPNRPAPESR